MKLKVHMTKLPMIVLLVAVTSVHVHGFFFCPGTESNRPSYWQIIPETAIQSCLIERGDQRETNMFGIFFELGNCFYWKKESLLLLHVVNSSGIMTFFAICKPMGVVQWQSHRNVPFTSYVYLTNKMNLGFNLSFSEFTMGYSGSECVYDKLMIETLDGLTVTGQDVYCGITPDWSHVALASAVRITVVNTGEYTTLIQLRYGPVNSNEYRYYDNKPPKIYLDQEFLLLDGEYSEFAQNIVKFEHSKSERMIISGHPMTLLSFSVKGELAKNSVIFVYDGPFLQNSKVLVSKLMDTKNSSLLDLTGQSNGPVVSVLYSRPYVTKSYEIRLIFEAMYNKIKKTDIVLRTDSDQQISSKDYCPSANGIIHCSFSVIAPRDFRPKFLFPNVSNLVLKYNGPDTDYCLYGVMLIYFDSNEPLTRLCREEYSTQFWTIASVTREIRFVMYSYNSPITVTFTASRSSCFGYISECDAGLSEMIYEFDQSPCAYIYRFPVPSLGLGDTNCNISVETMAAVGLKVKRGNWKGKCQYQVKFGSDEEFYSPDRIVGNTSTEDWPYLVPTTMRKSYQMFDIEMISNCQWPLTWLQIHVTPYCGDIDTGHPSKTKEVVFSKICPSA